MAKEKKEEILQWDMTPDEIVEIEALHQRRAGRKRLLEDLALLEATDFSLTQHWWEKLSARVGCKLMPGHPSLAANSTTGKVWVKDRVPELDDKLSSVLPES